MRQNPDTRSPFGPFQLGTAGSLEQSLTDIMNVAELLYVLAMSDADIPGRCLYPAADQLRRLHREAAAAMEAILAGNREVAA